MEPKSPLKRPRLEQDLFEYCESSSESNNGSSPSVNESIAFAIEREISQYRSDSQIERMEEPLRWWAANEHRFPTLSSLARRYLAIQATSVPSECMFSDAGTIVDRKRALDPDNVDHLMFLHKNCCVYEET